MLFKHQLSAVFSTRQYLINEFEDIKLWLRCFNVSRNTAKIFDFFRGILLVNDMQPPSLKCAHFFILIMLRIEKKYFPKILLILVNMILYFNNIFYNLTKVKLKVKKLKFFGFKSWNSLDLSRKNRFVKKKVIYNFTRESYRLQKKFIMKKKLFFLIFWHVWNKMQVSSSNCFFYA